MKVLVIQQRMGIGDMIIFLPYIHAISKKFQSKVSLLVKKNSKAEELFEDDDHIEEIINLDINKNNFGKHTGFSGFFKLLKEIKEKKFDKIFIFNSSVRYLLLAKLAGIKSINQYPLFLKKNNLVLTAKELIKKSIKENISTQPILYLDHNKIENVKNKYKFEKNFKHICIGFSASGPTKRWSIENYIKLAEILNKNKLCKFYLAGGRNDEILFNKFLNSSVSNICVSFKDLSISETLPIIKNCDIYIGNDTGWLHIASALNKKCLALFVDSPVQAYGKYSANISVVVPEGETEETTTHNTLGKEKINFEKVLKKSLELLN
ncbi:MAG: glycosyltransferase family 9 protein [Pelagibacteraceae bacterium]|nr:glycosyltransferase family 9 protein [Pelagibacteraceae bacterium]